MLRVLVSAFRIIFLDLIKTEKDKPKLLVCVCYLTVFKHFKMKITLLIMQMAIIPYIPFEL